MSDVSFQDEILMKTIRETGTTEDLTFVSIDEQMQIAKSMGIEVGCADKAAEFVVELTNESGVKLRGEKKLVLLVMMKQQELLKEDCQTST